MAGRWWHQLLQTQNLPWVGGHRRGEEPSAGVPQAELWCQREGNRVRESLSLSLSHTHTQRNVPSPARRCSPGRGDAAPGAAYPCEDGGGGSNDEVRFSLPIRLMGYKYNHVVIKNFLLLASTAVAVCRCRSGAAMCRTCAVDYIAPKKASKQTTS